MSDHRRDALRYMVAGLPQYPLKLEKFGEAETVVFRRPIPFPDIMPKTLMQQATESFFAELNRRLEALMDTLDDGQLLAFRYETGVDWTMTMHFQILEEGASPPPGAWYVSPPMSDEIRAELTKRRSR